MPTKSSKFVFLFFFTVFSLIVSLLFPSAVFADDGVPPSEEASETVSPVEDAATPEEETLTVDDVVSPSEEATEAIPPETLTAEMPETSVVEILAAMDEAGVALVDENGNPIPLVSETALELLTVPDPYVVRGGVTYRFLPIGGCAAFSGDPNCTESATPIQAAINFSVNGETIFVDPGTYVEQLEITKNIVLQATASGVIIKSPVLLTDFFVSGSNKNYPIVYVHDTANTSIIGFTIDGNGNGNDNYRFDGIGYYNAGGTIQGNTVQNITNSTFSGSQHGVGIFVYATDGLPHAISIDNNVIEDYQKNGMTITGNGITAEITNNTVTGAGPTTVIAQNGIQVSGGADALIQGNTVTGNAYTPQTVVSTGILFFGPGDVEIADNYLDGNDVNAYVTAAGNVEVTGNTILNGVWDGVWIDSSGPAVITGNTFSGNSEGVGLWGMTDMTAVHINGNVFTGNVLGVANYDAVDVDATGNFWGCPGGPDDPACDQVTTHVIYDPWLVKDPFVTPVNPFVPPVAVEKDTVKRSQSVPLMAGSGELAEISCESQSASFLVGEIKVVFTGLCGYETKLDLLTNELLPAKLDNSYKFLFGLDISLYQDGKPVSELPADANVTISYPATGLVMEWNSTTGDWQEIQAGEVNGRAEVDAGSGTFILIGE
ncbi:hypothetical protein ANAEL_03063 [Anaerolineales bacterium]|nr:hypothetical protein ANAEL_03063 [Anaerolineales bacterium]